MSMKVFQPIRGQDWGSALLKSVNWSLGRSALVFENVSLLRITDTIFETFTYSHLLQQMLPLYLQCLDHQYVLYMCISTKPFFLYLKLKAIHWRPILHFSYQKIVYHMRKKLKFMMLGWCIMNWLPEPPNNQVSTIFLNVCLRYLWRSPIKIKPDESEDTGRCYTITWLQQWNIWTCCLHL